MSTHLIQSAAKAQMDDRLRFAEQRRLAAHAPDRPSAKAVRPSGRRVSLHSFRAVFG